MKEIFTLLTPNKPLPLVLDSPHSGTEMPTDFNFSCDIDDLRSSTDHFIDELFSSAPQFGAALLKANFPRCYVDLNRAVSDIDPQLFETKCIEKSQSDLELNPTARSDAGIGLIWRLAKPGIPIYYKKLSTQEVSKRIETFYTPYHQKLEEIINQAHYNFGTVYHINCHSMPSSSATPKKPLSLIGHKPKQADFCLGTRDGTSCEQSFVTEVRNFLQRMGYHVTVNDPFKGVELVERHGDPARGRHSLQIEINRALYMNETTFEKSNNYESLKADIDKLIHFIADYVESQLTSKAAD